jgi:hypothetical protein
MEDVSRAQIWATLSKIDNKGLATDKFNGVQFVNWMASHATMMDHFPEYTWEFIMDSEGREAHYYPDGTAEVRCRMTIGGHTNITTLPIYNNLKAVQNPNSFQINTAKQRCRCKAMAEFGLFHHLWSKLAVQEELADDTPAKTERKPTAATKGADDLWAEHEATMMKAKTPGEAKKKWAKWQKLLENLGIEDSDEARWDKYLTALKEAA